MSVEARTRALFAVGASTAAFLGSAGLATSAEAAGKGLNKYQKAAEVYHQNVKMGYEQRQMIRRITALAAANADNQNPNVRVRKLEVAHNGSMHPLLEVSRGVYNPKTHTALEYVATIDDTDQTSPSGTLAKGGGVSIALYSHHADQAPQGIEAYDEAVEHPDSNTYNVHLTQKIGGYLVNASIAQAGPDVQHLGTAEAAEHLDTSKYGQSAAAVPLVAQAKRLVNGEVAGRVYKPVIPHNLIVGLSGQPPHVLV